MEKKLYRDEHHKTIGGVCAGLAEYFSVDVSVVRVIFVLALVLKGVGFLPYLVLWIVLPKRPYNFTDPNFKPGVTPGFNPNYAQGYRDIHVDYTVPPPPMPGQPFTGFAPKKTSNVGVIFGIILIGLGTLFLLDQLDFIPDWDFEKLWPVILVAIGATLLFGSKKQPWEKEGWAQEKKQEADHSADTKADVTEQPQNDNPTTL